MMRIVVGWWLVVLVAACGGEAPTLPPATVLTTALRPFDAFEVLGDEVCWMTREGTEGDPELACWQGGRSMPVDQAPRIAEPAPGFVVKDGGTTLWGFAGAYGFCGEGRVVQDGQGDVLPLLGPERVCIAGIIDLDGDVVTYLELDPRDPGATLWREHLATGERVKIFAVPWWGKATRVGRSDAELVVMIEHDRPWGSYRYRAGDLFAIDRAWPARWHTDLGSISGPGGAVRWADDLVVISNDLVRTESRLVWADQTDLVALPVRAWALTRVGGSLWMLGEDADGATTTLVGYRAGAVETYPLATPAVELRAFGDDALVVRYRDERLGDSLELQPLPPAP
ncbi:MAG: hypothetical protein R3B06_24480 [Kofleriaceae bacterium]